MHPLLTQLPSGPVLGANQHPLRCDLCHGIWVEPEVVLELGHSGILEQLDSSDTSRREQDHRTGVCPHGHGVMIRAKVHWEDPYYLERCSHCGGIWFDAGEWTRIAKANLIEHIEELWLPGWRRHLSRAESDERLASDLESRFGTEIHRMLGNLAAALADRSDAAMALAYLRRRIVEKRKRAGS